MQESIEQSLDDSPRNARCSVRWIAPIVLAGIVCRITQFLWRTSYWHDEAYLVLNVTRLTYRQLFGPLPHAQSAPPLFLVAQKFIGNFFGASEYAFRGLPLVQGVLAMVLMAVVARRLLGTVGVICAVSLFAFSDRLIWHAAEAKQYSGDALVALVMLVIATWPGISAATRLAIASIASAALIWWSHPVIFTYGGIAIVLSLEHVRANALDRARATSLAPLLTGLLPIASFVALYFVSIRHQQQSDLYAYWSDHFPNWSRPWTVPWWIAKDTFQLPVYGFEILGFGVAPAALAGAWTLWHERRGVLALVAVPILLTLLAALAGRYPYGGTRLTAFLIPSAMLLVGAGFDGIWCVLRDTKWRALGAALPIAVVAVGVVEATYYVVVPRQRGNARPVVQYVLQHREPGEPVYTLSEVNSFLPYWDKSAPPEPTSLEAVDDTGDARFWIMFAYADKDEKRRTVMSAMDVSTTFRKVDEFNVRGGVAFRFVRETLVAERNPAATNPASPATR